MVVAAHNASACTASMRARTASCSACGHIVVAVHAGKTGGVISRYASHC